MEPVRSEDCRLLLSLLKHAITSPEQDERVRGWLEAKQAALAGMEHLEKEMRDMAGDMAMARRFEAVGSWTVPQTTD